MPISAGAVVGIALEVRNVIAAENDTNRVRRARFAHNKIMAHRISSSLASAIITITDRLRAMPLAKKDLHSQVTAPMPRNTASFWVVFRVTSRARYIRDGTLVRRGS